VIGQSRTVIPLLVIVVLLSGILCSPMGRHAGTDFYFPVVCLTSLPIQDVNRRADSAPRAAGPFSDSYLPAAPDRAPPLTQTVLSV
jgi:hypothetical protein